MNKSSQVITTVQAPLDFFHDFIQTSNNASQRVLLQSMMFDNGPLINELVDTLCKTAKKGIDTRLHVDWLANQVSYGKLPLIPLLHFRFLRTRIQAKKERNRLYQMLLDANVHITTTNSPKFIGHMLPVIGRNHIKMYIVDDEVAWIGGINLMDDFFHNKDFMVKIKSKVLVKILSEQFFKTNNRKSTHDYSKIIAPGYTLLVDAGKPGSSSIYAEVVNMERTAKKSIVFISQYIPDKKLLSYLLEKTRLGINVTVITSSKDDAHFSEYPLKYFYKEFIKSIKNNKRIKLIHTDKRVHAKLLIKDDKEILFGSHNFVSSGVFLGTEEISIHSTDKHLLQQFDTYIHKKILKGN